MKAKRKRKHTPLPLPQQIQKEDVIQGPKAAKSDNRNRVAYRGSLYSAVHNHLLTSRAMSQGRPHRYCVRGPSHITPTQCWHNSTVSAPEVVTHIEWHILSILLSASMVLVCCEKVLSHNLSVGGAAMQILRTPRQSRKFHLTKRTLKSNQIFNIFVADNRQQQQ